MGGVTGSSRIGGKFERRVNRSGLRRLTLPQPVAGQIDHRTSANGGNGGIQRLGASFGQPIEARDTDENADALADWQVIREGH